MALDSRLFLHDSDKAALAALKAIPGFAQFTKAFMKVWSEKYLKVLNMSSKVKLGPNQMPKYYNMLPPICDKLGIEIPELYLELNVFPNAYTTGDTEPAITITSGLIETIPEELIPTVLAHECGHIACHHTLYTTMGVLLLNGAARSFNLSSTVMYPLKVAFYYWMRCSEFSADRAAIIYDGSADKTTELMMRFAGYDKDIPVEANVEAFLEQANEYRDMLLDSNYNKALEFLLYQDSDYNDHPLTVVRAYEGNEWSKGERFANIMDYLSSGGEDSSLPVELNPKKYVGKDVADAEADLMGKGMVNIQLARVTESEKKTKDGVITEIIIDGDNDPADEWYKRDARVVLTYYEGKSDEEIALEHPGEVLIEDNAKSFIGKKYMDVYDQFKELGFYNITAKEMALPKIALREKPDCVAKLIINGDSAFGKRTWFNPESEVIIYYYVQI